jgi:Bifunctional DNA primase/polymerase, N-terminal
VLTGGGGLHYYFAHPGGNVKGRVLASGLELKGDGQFVVTPPSLTGG